MTSASVPQIATARGKPATPGSAWDCSFPERCCHVVAWDMPAPPEPASPAEESPDGFYRPRLWQMPRCAALCCPVNGRLLRPANAGRPVRPTYLWSTYQLVNQKCVLSANGLKLVGLQIFTCEMVILEIFTHPLPSRSSKGDTLVGHPMVSLPPLCRHRRCHEGEGGGVQT